MVNAAFDSRLHPGDFTFQRLNAQLELFDRHRIEILLDQEGQRITGRAGVKLVQIHGTELRVQARQSQRHDSRQRADFVDNARADFRNEAL